MLHPGDVACVPQGEHLETLLGSCVAIALTDPRRSVGAMCHVVNPGRPVRGHGTTAYGEPAFAAMSQLLRRRGIDVAQCDAYVYGGGNMFPGLIGRGHVGSSNVRWALETLARLGVRVLEQDVGGELYRRVRWTVGADLPQVIGQPVGGVAARGMAR